MNEFVAVTSFICLALLVLVAARLGETFLFVLSVTFIILSNITVLMPVRVFGFEISWAIIIYSLVYFITDLLCEYHGRAAGYRLAATNLAVQVILWAYVWASLQVSPQPSGVEVYQTAEKLFATTAQITFAAIVASAGPFLDIFIFSSIRDWWDGVAARYKTIDSTLARFLRNKIWGLVTRNKLSTFAGQVVNTIIFFSFAFLGSGVAIDTLVSIIVTASGMKIVIAVADVPFLVMAERVLHLERHEGAA